MKSPGAALIFAGATLLAAASFPPRARADEAPAIEANAATIAVLCAPGDRFGLRLVAELESLGFRAVVLDPSTEPASRAALEASARGAGAIAAIRAVPSERGVEVWIADRVTGKTVLRDPANDRGTPELDDALALRVVELLRASLLEIALPTPSRGEVPATPEIREKMRVPEQIDAAPPSPRSPPRLRLSLAPGLLLSPGGFGGSGSLALGLDWMPSDHLGLCALAAIPLTSARVEGSQGSADLTVFLAGGGARFLFASRASAWSPSTDLGLLAVSLHSAGTAGAGFVASSPSTVTAAPFARVGLAFAPTPTLRLRADLLAGVVVPAASIQVHRPGVHRRERLRAARRTSPVWHDRDPEQRRGRPDVQDLSVVVGHRAAERMARLRRAVLRLVLPVARSAQSSRRQRTPCAGRGFLREPSSTIAAVR